MEIKKIKVLIITTTHFELDGITNVILNYYRAMDKTDMQIDFVVPNDIKDDLREELGSFGSIIHKIDGRNKKPFTYIKKLSNLINQNKYDIIHAHGNSCTLTLEMYAAKKAGVKVRIAHSHNSFCKHGIMHKLLRVPFYKYYTHGFTCGQKAGVWLYKNRPFEIINNGINIDKHKYNSDICEKYRDWYNLSGNKVIGHVGHFTYQKNHEYLIDIFNELYKLDSTYKLMLIGDGELRPNIEEKVNDMGLSKSVIFTGKTLDVPQLLQAMDIIVMPSRFEGLPLTLVEAQAACLPCFVSDVISREVAITGLVEFTSLDESPREWAEKINSKGTINREKMVNRVYKQIIDADYSIIDNAKQLKNLYKRYVAQAEN